MFVAKAWLGEGEGESGEVDGPVSSTWEHAVCVLWECVWGAVLLVSRFFYGLRWDYPDFCSVHEHQASAFLLARYGIRAHLCGGEAWEWEWALSGVSSVALSIVFPSAVKPPLCYRRVTDPALPCIHLLFQRRTHTGWCVLSLTCANARCRLHRAHACR